MGWVPAGSRREVLNLINALATPTSADPTSTPTPWPTECRRGAGTATCGECSPPGPACRPVVLRLPEPSRPSKAAPTDTSLTWSP